MFCSQCGKKVRENMLFCPFCGAVIEIPEQDEETAADALPAEGAPEPVIEPEAEPEWELREDASDEPAPEEEPIEEEPPFSASDWRGEEPEWMRDLPEEETPAPEISVEKPVPPPRRPVLAAQHPPRVSGSALDRDVRSSEARHYGKADPSPLNGGGLFMEDTPTPKKREADEYDDYDDPYDRDEEDDGDDGDSFEDDEPGFLIRHLRSAVGLVLFLVLAAIVFVYILSPGGQESLARANLAWRSDVYTRLGARSYNSGEYDQAGLYYERALSRSPNSYAYASSAARCYLDAGNTQKAAEMLKKCIALQPDAVDPYIYLLDLYPNAISRPLEVTQLIQQGYQRTGSDRLKLDP